MSRPSGFSGFVARGVFAAGLWLVLGAVPGALAQESGSTASTATAQEPAAEPSRRERRRRAEATASAVPAPGVVPPQAAASPVAVAATNPSSAEVEVVCKNIKPIGSRIPRRVCATEAEWTGTSERTVNSAQEEMRQMRDRAGLTGGPSSGPASLGAPTRF